MTETAEMTAEMLWTDGTDTVGTTDMVASLYEHGRADDLFDGWVALVAGGANSVRSLKAVARRDTQDPVVRTFVAETAKWLEKAVREQGARGFRGWVRVSDSYELDDSGDTPTLTE